MGLKNILVSNQNKILKLSSVLLTHKNLCQLIGKKDFPTATASTDPYSVNIISQSMVCVLLQVRVRNIPISNFLLLCNIDYLLLAKS